MSDTTTAAPILYAHAIRRIIRAGLASTYAEAVQTYGNRFVHARANTVWADSVDAIIADPDGTELGDVTTATGSGSAADDDDARGWDGYAGTRR